MLTLLLASVLTAPPAGGSWSISLHPAIVVRAEDPGPSLDLPEMAEPTPQVQDAPRLAPAKALRPKVQVRRAHASRKGR